MKEIDSIESHDGNCMFHAILAASNLSDTDNMHIDLRIAVT